MPVYYCTDDEVKEYLPDNLSSAVNTPTLRNPFREKAAWEVDGLVGPAYAVNNTTNKFEDEAASPGSPSYLRLPTALIAAAQVLLSDGWRADPDGGSMVGGEDLRLRALEMLREVRSGEIVLYDTVGSLLRQSHMVTNVSDTEPRYRLARYDESGTLLDDTLPYADRYKPQAGT